MDISTFDFIASSTNKYILMLSKHCYSNHLKNINRSEIVPLFSLVLFAQQLVTPTPHPPLLKYITVSKEGTSCCFKMH